MPEPLTFPSSTDKLALPMLLTGQAQKEFFINQSLSILDALWPRNVQGSADSPPAAALDGSCYRVTSPANGDWAGHEHSLAILVGGAWHFLQPTQGLRIYDEEAGQALYFIDQWAQAQDLISPIGGSTIDAEARIAIESIIEALRKSGILPSSA